MSSRRAEKEARRAEREAREAEQARAAANKKRLQLVGAVVGVLLAVGLIAALVFAGGDEDQPAANIPAPKITDFKKAVAAANCEYSKDNYEAGGDHTTKAVRYKVNPPSGGAHHPEPAGDGEYDPGNSPNPENWVHTLEHGRIIIQYKPGTPAPVIAQLRAVYEEKLKGSEAYHKVLMENNTEMDAQVAAVAWCHRLTCDTMNPQVFDALRTFSNEFVDKAPERVP